MFARDKHSSLLQVSVNDGYKKLNNIGSWCAISRAENLIQAVSAVSAATFAVSDFLIVINAFYHPLVYSQVWSGSSDNVIKQGQTVKLTQQQCQWQMYEKTTYQDKIKFISNTHFQMYKTLDITAIYMLNYIKNKHIYNHQSH